MNLNEERGNLLAENAGLSAKLRESRAKNRRLATEVARLREQVARLSRASDEGCACDATGPCYYHALASAGEEPNDG
jgi:hypothetical protein